MADNALDLDIRSDVKEVTRFLGRVNKDVKTKATVRSLNRTRDQVNTRVVRDLAKHTSLKQKLVRKSIVKVKATKYRLVAQLVASGYAFNLIEFVGPGKRAPDAFRRRAGVRARAWGKSRVYPHTFIIRGKGSGKPVVVTRHKGAQRAGNRWKAGWSKTIYGPSIPREFIQARVLRIMQTEARTRFRKNFERDVRYYISKASRRR